MTMMKNTEIIFYICTPVYKVEKYIDECITSVLNQTYDNYHLVLVDDGSPDRCGEICDKYREKHKEYISVIHKSNQGLLAARETAIKYVKQIAEKEKINYIIHLDSDDYLQENALEVIAQTVARTDCDLLMFGWNRVSDGHIKSSPKVKFFVGEIDSKRDLYNLVFNDSVYNPLWRKAARLELYTQTSYSEYYHIQLAEDLLQSIILYKNCKKAVFISEKLYNYTVNPNSLTQAIDYSKFSINTQVRENVLRFLESESEILENDIAKYKNYCKQILSNLLFQVSRANITKEKKKDMLKQLTENNYYSSLMKDKFNKIDLWLLNKKQYMNAMLASKILHYCYSFQKRIKRMGRNKNGY